MGGEVLGEAQGIGNVRVHPQRQGLQSLQEEEHVEGRQRGAEITQLLNP